MTMEGIPQYSQYPNYPYMYPPATAPQPAADQPTKPVGRPRLYALIVGVIFTILIVAAIALAAYSPSLAPTESGAIPRGWTKVYDANLTAGDDGRWDQSQGCAFGSSGLNADASSSSNAALCAFKPSETQDLASGGFLLEMTLTPAANITSEAVPLIVLGSDTSGAVFVFADQQGNYTICQANCDTATRQGVLESGSTATWHGDPYVANTFAVQFVQQGLNNNPTITLFINGEQVAQIDVSQAINVSAGAAIPFGVGSLSGGAEVYTHATLYTGGVSSL